MKILILEDDLQRVTAFKAEFKKVLGFEYSMDHVENANDAIHLLKSKSYDAIFLDHDLGGRQMNYDKENCGTMVSDFILQNPEYIENTKLIIVHSLNFPAAKRMCQSIKGSYHFPFAWQRLSCDPYVLYIVKKYMEQKKEINIH